MLRILGGRSRRITDIAQRISCLHWLHSGSSLCGGSGVGLVHDVEKISSVQHSSEIYPGGDANTTDFFDLRGQKLTMGTGRNVRIADD